MADANSKDLSSNVAETQTKAAMIMEPSTYRAVTHLQLDVPEIDSEAQLLLTALAEIGSIQEQEEKSDAAIHEEIECSDSRVFFYRFGGRECCVPVVKLEPSMIKTQEIGRDLLKQKVLPLFSTNGRKLWIYVQLVLVLWFGLKCAIIDIAVNSPSTRTPVDFASLAFSLVFLTLSILDTFGTIRYSSLVCTPCRGCRATNKLSDGATAAAAAAAAAGINSISANLKYERCRSFSLLNSKYVDLFRMILNEVIVYTITICTMLQLILNSKQDGNKLQLAVSIISFIIAVLWKIATVYSTCIFVVVRTIFKLRMIRKDGPVASSANWCHVHLIIHVLAQMVSQVSMIVCIGAKMHYENRNFSVDNTVQISPALWYMFFGALIIPLAGVFTFVISNFYSVQEYPIGYFLDLLHSRSATRKKCGSEEQSAQEIAQSTKPEFSSEKAKKVVQKIKAEFTYIHNQSPLKKYCYVFVSPLLATSSVVYTLLILAFLACCVLEPTSVGTQLVVLYNSSTGWTFFFVITALLVCAVNMLVLLIGALWIAIILAIVAACILICYYGNGTNWTCDYCYAENEQQASPEERRIT